ncbi:MAG: SPOR domain-containing protein [candidate division WOR-3 bacterium]|nr:SPOR domain-containing protein [candidate division WOR-3 bacterium]
MRGIIVLFLILLLCLFSCSVRETTPIIKVTPEEEVVQRRPDTVEIEVVSTVPEGQIQLAETVETNEEAFVGFSVQIGAYSNYENASRCKLEAQKRLSEEIFIEIEDSYYKVRVGRYPERVYTEGIKDKIKGFFPDAFIVEKK